MDWHHFITAISFCLLVEGKSAKGKVWPLQVQRGRLMGTLNKHRSRLRDARFPISQRIWTALGEPDQPYLSRSAPDQNCPRYGPKTGFGKAKNRKWDHPEK